MRADLTQRGRAALPAAPLKDLDKAMQCLPLTDVQLDGEPWLKRYPDGSVAWHIGCEGRIGQRQAEPLSAAVGIELQVSAAGSSEITAWLEIESGLALNDAFEGMLSVDARAYGWWTLFCFRGVYHPQFHTWAFTEEGLD